MARTLASIAASGGESFYRGELAATMAAHAQSYGARHTTEDFARHASDWVSPLSLEYRGATVHQIPPNGQGIAALQALGILREFDMRGDSPTRCPRSTARSRR
jgi:gamma-glutamyltranspeptidase/glutathione hydrolase